MPRGQRSGMSGVLAPSLLCRDFRRIPLYGEADRVWLVWKTNLGSIQGHGRRGGLDWRFPDCLDSFIAGMGAGEPTESGGQSALVGGWVREMSPNASGESIADRGGVGHGACASPATMGSGHRMRFIRSI